ncbi:MAG: recombination protein NinG [Bacteroidales bacterium]
MDLKAKLDRVFSEYIRLRDSDSRGYVRCISCGKIVHWKEADCGHYVNRAHMGTRFSEHNCNGQCRFCNRFDEGNNIGYTRGLISKYGVKIIADLEVKKHSQTHLTKFDYEIMIKHYKEEVKRLKREKGL